MSNGTTIAVVVPVYNCAAYVEETLRSLESQTQRPHRVVVVDDGSTDGTGRIVADFAARSALPLEIITQPNRGIAGARNAGIERCNEDLVAFLDGDDVFYPTFLARGADALLHHPELLLCFLDRDVVDAAGNFLRHDLDEPKFRAIAAERLPDGVSVLAQDPFLSLVSGNVIPIGLMVRRSAIQQIRGFDEEMRFVEDKLFLMQLAKLGTFGFLDVPLGTWRRHGSNTSGAGNAFRMAYYGDLALEKIQRQAAQLKLTAGELAAIQAQRTENARHLLYAASNEASPEFFRMTWKLVREGRAPWTAMPRACLRYGWRRMAGPAGLTGAGLQKEHTLKAPD